MTNILWLCEQEVKGEKMKFEQIRNIADKILIPSDGEVYIF